MTALLPAPVRARPRPVLDLRGPGRRTAIHSADAQISYAELDQRVGDFASDALGTTRRLVVVEGANTLDSLTAYLAALQHGHVALLVPDGRARPLEQLVDAYDPDVVVRQERGRQRVEERRADSAHDLHPDLALLLSTSGSTGSPKLVRLSHDNLRSNATAIATSLGLTAEDRAATSLPLHYCYGLSVVNSHLVTGASLALTGLSVVDECFWELFAAAGATSFAGVPYTFDLLDSSGFAQRSLPSLRQVTQAGGRLAPERVRQWAELGHRSGWELVVMYGQTEATARMAYLPPHLATRHPWAVGVPVPGGSFRLDPVPESTEPGTGELVYRGPNVMMGYAQAPADLAAGASLDELRTGDLARCRDGLYEIVGRRDRHAKLFGLRVDLDRVEAAVPTPVACVVAGSLLHAFTTRSRSSARLAGELAEACGVPVGAVRVHLVASLPRTPSGKPDRIALERQARLLVDPPRSARPADGVTVTAESIRDDYAVVLGRPDASVHSSFVSLGGDSLSYVELATRLGARLDRLPTGWHTLPITELVATRPRRPRWGTSVDTSVLLRALAILLVVGSHANLFALPGGAHVLLAVAGFNFARFQLAAVPRLTRVRHGLAAVAQVAVPATLVIGGLALLRGTYDAPTALLLNGVTGSDTWTDEWQFWFLEVLVWTSLAALAALAVPAVDRWERRTPFGFAATLVLGALALRYAWTGVETGATERYTIGPVLWVFALGWAAARARTLPQRLLVTVATAVGVAGFFGDPGRELLVAGGIALLTWVGTVRLPRVVVPWVGVLAGASLFVYLTHWQVYPFLEMNHPFLATLASLALGVATWWAARPGLRRLGTLLRGGISARP